MQIIKDMKENKKLKGKLILEGCIKVMTGLAIGGNKSGIDIGALDNPVIKYRNGNNYYPYIPGSSLKGKIRSLLAKVAGFESERQDKAAMKKDGDFKHLATLFGYGAGQNDKQSGAGLLKFNDSFLKDEKLEVTEEKMENTIDRISGKANPRPLERVLPDSIFEVNLILDVYDEQEAEEHLKLLDLGIQLLNQDYLGGGGTRGNGRVEMRTKIKEYLEVDTQSKKLNNKLEDTQSFKNFKFTYEYEKN